MPEGQASDRSPDPDRGEEPIVSDASRRGRRRVLWRLAFGILLVGLILAVADLLVFTVSVILLVFAGVLFGIFLNGLARWVVRLTPLPYRAAFAVVVVTFLGVLGLGFYLTGAQIVDQAANLRQELASAREQLAAQLEQYGWEELTVPGLSQIPQLLSEGSGVTSKVMRGARWVAWGLTGLLVIFVVGLYTAYEPDLYKTGLLKLIPLQKRDHAAEILEKLRKTLGYWIVGRLISMAIVGLLTAIGLWLLNVPLPITLGALAAILTFIPNIGPILAAVPQALLAWKVGPSTVLYVVAFNIVLQGVESYVITPIVQRYEVSLPPALTISVQLLMGGLFGVIGVMMAAPATAACMLLTQTLYIRDRLHDTSPGQLAEKT